MALGLQTVTAVLLFASLPQVVVGGGFLEQTESLQEDAKVIHGEIQGAIDGVLGCGGHIRDDQLPLIEADLTPIWRSLPKNSHGRIERGMLRYIAHRYFMQKSALMIRGLEPTRKLNTSDSGSANILSQEMPGLVETVLEAEHVEDHGFGMKEVVHVVAIIEELIWDSESHLLEKVYTRSGRPITEPVTHNELHEMLDDYLVYWLLGDRADIPELLSNRERLPRKMRNWPHFTHLSNGLVALLEHRRQHASGRNGLNDLFTFDDAHAMVADLTKEWSSFYNSECERLKAPLLKLDQDSTGRTSLSRFYGAGKGFAESEEYLREVGALEENSHLGGKQVLIANYLQIASNCVVSTPHYHVCCHNPCEAILGDIEAAMASPVATAEDILYFVGNMSASDLIRDHALVLSKPLVAQLGSIATKHNGMVPLHGRRFAQWLHYVFPRDCPFPHKLGTVSSVRHTEFGGAALLEKDERERLASVKDASTATNASWSFETQWSSEEELLADYGSELQAPWERSRFPRFGTLLCLLVLAALGGAAWMAKEQKGFATELPSMKGFAGELSSMSKQHTV